MKKFADTIVRESVASAMQHNRLPDELSVVDVHKAILKLPRCDFLRNSYLGYKKEDTMGSYPIAAATAATSDSKEVKTETSFTDVSSATSTVNVKSEPMETMESSMINMETELSNQGMSSTVGSVASSLNLKMEVMDESSNETRSLTRSGDRIQMERPKSLSRTSSLASMTDFETLIPEFEIPPLMQDDWEVLFPC